MTFCGPAPAILNTLSARWIACSASAAMTPCCGCTRTSVVTIGTSTPPPPLTTSMPTVSIGTVMRRESSGDQGLKLYAAYKDSGERWVGQLWAGCGEDFDASVSQQTIE